jgi:hypothetical protein
VRIANSDHEARPWLIRDIAPDFRLLDVWALPVEGARDEFGDFLELMAALDPADAGTLSRALFWVRLRLGDLFGWDDTTKQQPIPGSRETSLSERLPAELRGSAATPVLSGETQRVAGFEPLYRTEDEWAAEVSNETVHGVLHLTWVAQDDGRYAGRLAIYVKTRGLLGAAYLRLIDPFRQLVVYPAVIRQVQRAWAARPDRARVPGLRGRASPPSARGSSR